MTRKQKYFLAVVIIVPSLLGMIINLTLNKNSSYSSNSTSPFGGKRVGIVRVENIIMNGEDVVKQIEDFRADKNIVGVLLRVNSPGGAVGPSQEIFSAVTRFKNSGKPIVVSMGNVAASGGYYISAPSTRIFANPGTITGSIGVIFQFPQYYNLMDKIGVKMTTIKAGKLKDIGNPNRDITNAEKIFLQKFLDNTHMQFINDVSKGRAMETDSVKTLADGRIYTGEQALKVGLIDTLGGLSDALSYLKDLTGVALDSKPVTRQKKVDIFRDMLSETIFDKIPLLRNSALPTGNYYLLQNF